MKRFIIILVLFFFVSVQGKKNKTRPCSVYINNLITAERDFTGCTVEYSVPVSFCISCKKYYDLLTTNFNDFVNANDTKTNVSCKSIFFDRDRMNIVETVYDQLTGIWNKGFCSECWSNWTETEAMLENITNFESCILQNDRKEACQKCEKHYLGINTMYEIIEREHKSKVCFDIQDMGKPKHTCDSRLSRMWARENLFSMCVFTNLIPTAKYCQACLNDFNEVGVHYKEFMEGEDSKTKKKCKEEYKDNLHVINVMYNYSNQLWKELACNECIVHHDETASFVKDCQHFHECVEKNKTDPCTNCSYAYQKVINVYNNIREEHPRRICGEILDNMKHVQTVWTANHCNKKEKSSLTVFLAVSSALMLLPAIFYGGLAKISFNSYTDDNNETQERPISVEGKGGSGEALPSVEPTASGSNKADKNEFEEKDGYSSDILMDSDEDLKSNKGKHELMKIFEKLDVPPKEELPHDLLKSENSSDEELVFSSPPVTNSQNILLEI